MLADRRASAFVSNFAGQWLHLRNLRGKVPNSELFPDFDDNLRQAFQREAELFFESIIREDRSVLDLMTRRLHVRQRAAGASLRDPERRSAATSVACRSPTRHAAASWARAPCCS